MRNLRPPELHTFKSGYIGNPAELNTNEEPMLPNVGDQTEKNPDYFNQQRKQIEDFPGLLPTDFNRELNEITARKPHPMDRSTTEPPMLPAGIDPNICFDCD